MIASGRRSPGEKRHELLRIALRLPPGLLAISPSAVKSLPDPVSEASGAEAVGGLANEWWWPLVDWLQRESKLEGFDSRLHGTRLLRDYVAGRLRTHHAASIAAAGARADQVLSMLWEEHDSLLAWPRFEVATTDDKVKIGKALRSKIGDIITGGLIQEQIRIPTSVLSNRLPALSAPFHWDYLRALSHIGSVLESRFHQMLDFAAAADPTDFDENILGKLDLIVLHGLLSTRETHEDRLLQLLRHPDLHVVAVAFVELLHRFQTDPVDGQAALELFWEMAGRPRRPEVDERWHVFKEELTRLRKQRSQQINGMEQALASRMPELGALVRTGMRNASRHDMVADALARAAVTQENAGLAAFLDEAIAEAQRTRSWDLCESLAVAVGAKDRAAHDKIAESCLNWWQGKTQPTDPSSLVGQPWCLLTAGLVVAGHRSPDSFWKARHISKERAFDLAQGRYTNLRHFSADDAFRREIAAEMLVAENTPTENSEVATRLWNEQMDWLSRMIPLSTQLPPYLLDTLAWHLLRQIDPRCDDEVGRGADLICAAVESENFTHGWSLWMPSDQPKRGLLLRTAHDRHLHISVPFLVETVRTGTNVFQNLAALLLETSCADCRRVTLERLGRLEGGPIREAARAILDSQPRSLEAALRKLLGAPLLHMDYVRLRDAIVTTARDAEAPIDIDAIAADYWWAREMEQLGVADQTRVIEIPGPR